MTLNAHGNVFNEVRSSFDLLLAKLSEWRLIWKKRGSGLYEKTRNPEKQKGQSAYDLEHWTIPFNRVSHTDVAGATSFWNALLPDLTSSEAPSLPLFKGDI